MLCFLVYVWFITETLVFNETFLFLLESWLQIEVVKIWIRYLSDEQGDMNNSSPVHFMFPGLSRYPAL